MKAWTGLVVALTACGFEPGSAAVDADLPNDVVDAPAPMRVAAGLIGLWTFDDANGTKLAADSSGTTSLVPLQVITSSTIAAPTFADSSVTAVTPARLLSPQSTHIPADCGSAGAVTFEVWVMPAAASQGSSLEPRFIAGIAGSVTLRDVVLLQSGTTWLGRVRTSAALDGTPDLRGITAPAPGSMTHLVVVADAGQRALYVDAVVEASSTPGGPLGWDTSYPMALFDEPQHAREWLGSMALVAIYGRALSAVEVRQNFIAGPNAH